jgi:hypothetical protein
MVQAWGFTRSKPGRLHVMIQSVARAALPSRHERLILPAHEPGEKDSQGKDFRTGHGRELLTLQLANHACGPRSSCHVPLLGTQGQDLVLDKHLYRN